MDIKRLLGKTIEWVKKYRYALLVLAIGLVMMVIPNNDQLNATQDPEMTNEIVAEDTLEDKLTSILSQVQGAGEVQVILSIAAGKETIYQTDENTNTDSDSNNLDKDTVTITDADRNQFGLVRQVNPAVYQGAVVICEGADNPSVKLALIDAVSKLTGLGANCIAVLKMK